MPKKKKKVTKRNSEKYPALRPELNLKSRYEEIADIDYVDQLSEEEKAWLNAFNEEYINANFNHNGPNIHQNKKKKDAFKKVAYDRNNARNRCILTRKIASGLDVSLAEGSGRNRSESDKDFSSPTVTVNYEDYLIAVTDDKKRKYKPKKKK